MKRSLSLCARHSRRIFAIAIAAAIFCVAPPSALLAQDATPTTETVDGGYYYTVRAGDSWTVVARRVGVSVAELQRLNPRSMRVNEWLRTGEKLFIPTTGEGEPTPQPTNSPTATRTRATPAATSTTRPTPFSAQPAEEAAYHVVGGGESWNSIAARYDVPARVLRAANPDLVRPSLVLYRGERLLIPAADYVTPTPDASSIQQGVEFTPTPTSTPTNTPTPTPTPTEFTAKDAQVEEATPGAPDEPPTETPTPTVTPVTQIGLDCPANFSDYPAQINSVLNTAEFGIEGLRSWLEDCGSAVDGGIQIGDLTGDGADELMVIFADPNAPENAPAGELILYDFGDSGFTEVFRARAGGRVELLEVADINEDGRPDIVFSDSTCGASTCFDTIHVRSWDGVEWVNWVDGALTMAYPEIRIEDVLPEGQGMEIVLEGGVYGSAGAGPQRSRIETWASVGGAPYQRASVAHADSKCIYFALIDANAEFLKLPNADLAQLEQLYTRAATDPALTTCWNHADEEAELRSFALFRLALVAAYQGVPEISGDLITSISEIYPASIYGEAGRVWLDTFQATNSIPEACSAVNAFAQRNPAAFEALADYGYANPSFGPNDVCPVLDVEEDATSAATGIAGAAAAGPTADPFAESAPTPQIEPAPDEALQGTQPLVAEAAACPADLAGYAQALPAVLASAAGDQEAARAWMTECAALSDKRGALVFGDFNGDGIEDAFALPVIISDLGFGPGGAQGGVILLHGDEDGAFTVAHNPEIFGESLLLAVEDLTGDGAIDLAWSVVGCSTFCVTEVQIVTWNEEQGEYISQVEPGATLAEGKATFEALPSGAPGQGRMLVLEGGVSDTPEGGLAVPHREEWQSIAGSPFQRTSWLYDRDVQGNDCMGLRLVEADTLLQAAPALGYEGAIEAYEAAFDPELKSCSIFGIDGEQELVLLQGLAGFRLMQAQALAGDMKAAKVSLEALTQGQPEGSYAEAAAKWLDAFEADSDAAAACEAVSSIFSADEEAWQITDHFGYNHPALAAEQLCYAPPEEE